MICGLKNVVKFGGTSVGDAEAISNAIEIVKEYVRKGHKIVS